MMETLLVNELSIARLQVQICLEYTYTSCTPTFFKKAVEINLRDLLNEGL